MTHSNLLQKLEAQLAGQEPRTDTEWEATPAAVLVPFFRENDEWHLLFTRRTDHLESHQGQVSFPGGALEPGDASPEAAALREAQEEIGLRPEEVRIHGQLDSLLTVTQFHVTPIVASIPWPFDLQINHHEVANVFGVPLRWLLDPANLELRHRDSPMTGKPVPVYYFRPYAGEVIWGVTGRITVDLLECIRPLLQ